MKTRQALQAKVRGVAVVLFELAGIGWLAWSAWTITAAAGGVVVGLGFAYLS